MGVPGSGAGPVYRVLDQAPLTHSLQTLWSAPVGQRGTTRAVTGVQFVVLRNVKY
jgi:hypothetical protein